MNIQDISDFLDLVKNPDKYAKVLKDLKDEQDRLNAVIATVGKASELESLRKQVEKKAAKLDSDFEKKEATLQTSISGKLAILSEKEQKLNDAIAEQKQMTASAASRIASAEDIANEYKRREKAIRQQEDFLTEENARVSDMAKEYEDKLAKLRSVMA